MPSGELRIVDPDPAWTRRFEVIGAGLRRVLVDEAVRIDHVGSTAVAGLAAKDVIDVQVTVADLAVADGWPDLLLDGVRRRSVVGDHVPPGGSEDPAAWAKRYWSDSAGVHVHVREAGRANQRYALLFRDFLRADPVAAGAYARLKIALTEFAPDDWDAYYDVKDPACDLIIAGAEHWAAGTGWSQGPSDA